MDKDILKNALTPNMKDEYFNEVQVEIITKQSKTIIIEEDNEIYFMETEIQINTNTSTIFVAYSEIASMIII
jgi:hypothetical protein